MVSGAYIHDCFQINAINIIILWLETTKGLTSLEDRIHKPSGRSARAFYTYLCFVLFPSVFQVKPMTREMKLIP